MLSRSEIDRSPSAPPPSTAPAPSSSSAEAPPPCPHRSTPIHDHTPPPPGLTFFFALPFLACLPCQPPLPSWLTCQPRRRQAGLLVSLVITCQVRRCQAGSLVDRAVAEPAFLPGVSIQLGLHRPH